MSPLSPPSGCPFRTRCFKPTDYCAEVEPDLAERTAPGHFSACHYAGPLEPDQARPSVAASGQMNLSSVDS